MVRGSGGSIFLFSNGPIHEVVIDRAGAVTIDCAATR